MLYDMGELYLATGQTVKAQECFLEVYAASIAETYGQEKVPFLYAQPTASLVEGIAAPKIKGALSIEFDEWPKSLQAIATQLGTLAAEKLK